MSGRRFLVVADDLSGAADCGIAFTRAGLPAAVLLANAGPAAVDVLVVDTDSRHLPPDRAAAVTQQAARRHLTAGTRLYKKIDSTLRGNLAPELAAILPPAGLAIVAPAFPATGRTTRDGRVYVNDVPLEATEPWQREQMTGVADIAAILGRSGIASTRAGLALVRGGPEALRQALDAMAGSGAAAIVCDAETDSDLAAIAAASLRLTRKLFWVGSAGLAYHLASAAGPAGEDTARSASPPRLIARPRVPVLTVVGSLSAVSHQQAARLAAVPGVTAVTVAPRALRDGPANPDWHAAATALDAALAADCDVVLCIGDSETADLREGPLLCTALARLVLPSAHRLGSLIATGGDTAKAILSVQGVAVLHLANEIEPGVALSVAGGEHRLAVVTKAGAFGGPETLVHCRAVLRGATPAGS